MANAAHGTTATRARRSTAIDNVLAVEIVAQLEALRPLAELDAALDAAAACFARFGLARTSVPDIARELGVSRATVYRTAGTVEDLARLLVRRDLCVLVADAVDATDGPAPERTVAVLDELLRAIHEHPVLSKVLAHEPDLVRSRLLEGWPELLAGVRGPIATGLAAGMDAGLLRPGDPAVMAEAIARLALSLVLTPTPTPRPVLEAVLLPMLTPDDPAR